MFKVVCELARGLRANREQSQDQTEVSLPLQLVLPTYFYLLHTFIINITSSHGTSVHLSVQMQLRARVHSLMSMN